MCNHYRADPKWAERTGEFSHLKLPLRFPDPSRNYVPPTHVYPGRDGAIIRPSAEGDALEVSYARWGLVPFFHRKPAREWKAACQNCKSEEMAEKASFKGALARRRCLVPADAFYESCGVGTRQEWEITRKDGELFMFAGLWDHAGPDDDRFESYTILTSAPGPDVAQWHNRQPVALAPQEWATWLDPAQPYDRLVQPPTEAGVLQAVAVPIGGRETKAV